jgi:Glucose dehydrogenase C-terminus/FAD binding domain
MGPHRGPGVWRPRVVLVVGAGPIGLLAALLAVQAGLEVHVLDRVTTGPKPALVADLGAIYHTGTVTEAGPDSIVCLTGVSSAGRRLTIDAGAVNRELVLDNGVVFGTVNANRRHYQAAATALANGRSAVVVLVVGDVVAPVGLGSLVARGFGDGQMGHEVVRGGAVPVPLVGGRGDDVTGSDLLDGAAAGLHQPPALGDIQGLPDGVGVPGGAGPGGEPDGADPHA